MAELDVRHRRYDLREEGASAGVFRLLKYWGEEGEEEEGEGKVDGFIYRCV